MTKVYGAGDDLIEFDGDIHGEVGAYGTDDEDSKGVLLMFSDGTILTAKYGKADMAVWGFSVVKAGSLFECLEHCDNEDQDPHSDVVKFKDGLKWAYAARQWERVK